MIVNDSRKLVEKSNVFLLMVTASHDRDEWAVEADYSFDLMFSCSANDCCVGLLSWLEWVDGL